MVFLHQWEEKFIFSVQMESYNIDLLEVNVQEGKEGGERRGRGRDRKTSNRFCLSYHLLQINVSFNTYDRESMCDGNVLCRSQCSPTVYVPRAEL